MDYTVEQLIERLTRAWQFPQYISIVGYEYSVGNSKRTPSERCRTTDPKHNFYHTNFSLTWKAVYHPSTAIIRAPYGHFSYQGLKGKKANSFHTITHYIVGFNATQLFNMEAEIVEQYKAAGRHVWLRDSSVSCFFCCFFGQYVETCRFASSIFSLSSRS